MSYSDEEIMRRLRLGEDSAWEFKQVEFSGDRPTSPRREDWANEIAAFANASGGALLCGVSDDGDVQGMSRQQITNLDTLLVEICTDAIKPPGPHQYISPRTRRRQTGPAGRSAAGRFAARSTGRELHTGWRVQAPHD